jgi:hypothetical protein
VAERATSMLPAITNDTSDRSVIIHSEAADNATTVFNRLYFFRRCARPEVTGG